MVGMIVGTIFGLCLFIVPVWAYRRGLQDGLALNQGKTPEPIKSPIQVVTEHRDRQQEMKETKEANDKLSEGLTNLMAYDGSPQKKAGEA